MESLTPEMIQILTETWLSTILAILYFTEIRVMKQKINKNWETLQRIENTIKRIAEKRDEDMLLKKVEEMIQKK